MVRSSPPSGHSSSLATHPTFNVTTSPSLSTCPGCSWPSTKRVPTYALLARAPSCPTPTWRWLISSLQAHVNSSSRPAIDYSAKMARWPPTSPGPSSKNTSSGLGPSSMLNHFALLVGAIPRSIPRRRRRRRRRIRTPSSLQPRRRSKAVLLQPPPKRCPKRSATTSPRQTVPAPTACSSTG